MPFAPESFDHVFVCFVLEHLSRPVEALAILNRLLRPGGTMTVIEGDHGSAYFHPDSSAAQLAIRGAKPLQYNGYKVPLMRNLVKRAIRGTAAKEAA